MKQRHWLLPVLSVTATVLTTGVGAAQPDAVRTVVTKLAAPWGVAFLPDGSALVTERDSTRVLSVRGTTATEVARITEARPSGEGGLLGIAVSPRYATDGLVFVYYTAASDNRIARFKLGERPQPLVTGIPKAGVHNGGRLAFGPDGLLYASTGDAGRTSLSQDRGSLGGKILRMTADGAPAPGNPFGSLVYSLGHRNVQGMAWDTRGRMYASEFGQNRLDELNRIESGKNYGWPQCEGTCADPAFTNPLRTWSTTEASPSGIAVYKDNVYLAALRGQALWQVPLNPDGSTGTPRALFRGEYGRLRDTAVAPDGTLWVLTSNRDGRGDPGPDDDRILSTDG
ncbi:PQQ-dependent sugar dehydrogenase [Allokutzneria sp. A3M-2-11 16]|uniref:PQQ-dependent sugar dehydrogenase n=1 Tax=Allokutzneria sp. A3M-2-11 16 TaxID=2962043 RepID=UPI0020B6E56E|nr:PQQ-dependent sugar dehydrogenase [Allokutzneria sp. A3M-2-11 16]MCP3805005.1 PQQ-dependent sugar dehydrogenase [Allokutzneria sp. A3M-2-11 16]